MRRHSLNEAIDILQQSIGKRFDIADDGGNIFIKPHDQVNKEELESLGLITNKEREPFKRLHPDALNAMASELIFLANPEGLQKEIRQERMDPKRRAASENVLAVIEDYVGFYNPAFTAIGDSALKKTGPKRSSEEREAIIKTILGDYEHNRDPLTLAPLGEFLNLPASPDPLLNKLGLGRGLVTALDTGHVDGHELIMANPDRFPGGTRFTHNPANLRPENESSNRSKSNDTKAPTTVDQMKSRLETRLTDALNMELNIDDHIRHLSQLEQDYPKYKDIIQSLYQKLRV